ncbi:DEKNAAC104271 [Brettanomyces naardenensis]|uniref:DEKNAAC104271 n=1 Tax=Brettanomyces naardenensis TaxID=13370 RepID=A0A448YQE2_BRENA|nr:DEKNAAC104271 [Brettanomyces naardenensis]
MAPLIVKFEDKYAASSSSSSSTPSKLLRSGKPLSLSQLNKKRLISDSQKLRQAKNKEDQANIKNDLELQRLLDESHILSRSSSNYSGSELTLKTLNDGMMGSSRVRTLDSRMSKLSETNRTGGKKLENMSMNLRQGMVKAQMKRVDKYEEEAKEAGIILSKNKKGEFRTIRDTGMTSFTDRIGKGVKKKVRMRDRGLRVNGIGRATSHGVVLSKGDIEKMKGPRRRRK